MKPLFSLNRNPLPLLLTGAVLLLATTTSLTAQEPQTPSVNQPISTQQQTQPATNTKASSPAPRKAPNPSPGKPTLKTFTPSEQIDPDAAVSFPSDI